MRIVFMGTPEFSVPALRSLVSAGHDIVAAYTQPPRPKQRGKHLIPSAVHVEAEALGIEVRTPINFKHSDDIASFADLAADVAVVVAYGLILPQSVLDVPRHGCINIHASLLPRWRGAAPIQRAILAGDRETGITTMLMERGLDTGPMLRVIRTAIDGKTAGELTTELADLGAALIVDTLANFIEIKPAPQPDAGVTYAHKIDKAEAALNFMKPAIELERAVRAFNPSPGAFCQLGPERIRILEADVVEAIGTPGTVMDSRFTIACSTGALRPLRVQRSGKRAMRADEMLRGLSIPPGTRLD